MSCWWAKIEYGKANATDLANADSTGKFKDASTAGS